jgi:hypothetical protein
MMTPLEGSEEPRFRPVVDALPLPAAQHTRLKEKVGRKAVEGRREILEATTQQHDVTHRSLM